MSRQTVFAVLSFLAILVGGYHLFGLIYKLDSSPGWRHALFTLISIFCAFGFLKRPTYFIYAFVVLSAQQYFSHGSSLLLEWFEYSRVDWISLILLVAYPNIIALLVVDFKSRTRKRHRG